MRWILRILGVVVTLVLAAVIVVALIPTERVAALAAGEFRKLTGRALTIEGDVRPQLWPELGVSLTDVAVADADWAGPDPMFTAKALSVSLDIGALMSGDIRITGITVEESALRLVRAADGRANWEIGAQAAPPAAAVDDGAAPTAAPAGPGRRITLDSARLVAAEILYEDRAAGQSYRLSDLDLETAVPDIDGPVSVGLAGQLNNAPLAAEIDIARLSDLLDGRIAGIAANVDFAGARLQFDGRAGGAPVSAEGRIAFEGQDGLADVFAALDLPAPALPEGAGRDRLVLAAGVTYDASGTLYLRDLALEADGNRITGALDLALDGPRPRLTADLSAGALRLPAAASGGGAGGGSGTAAEAPQAAGWPADPIDVSALGLLDATLALRAESVAAGPVTIGSTRLLARLEDRRLVLEIAEMAAYGGGVSGQVVVNGRGGLSASTDLTANGVRLQPLLTAFAGYDRLLAAADLRLKTLSSGPSVDALMRNLSGEGSLALGQGELRGLDLAGMIRNLDPGYVGEGQKTIFDSVTASYTIAGGILTNSDLAFSAPLLVAEGRGEVDLGNQSLDYRLIPTALPGADGTGGLRVPLMIAGPWSKPRFGLDLEGLADQRLQVEEEKIRERAGELLQQKAEDLGITPEAGESLEDAARRKLEDRAEETLEREAEKLLRGLLGGN